MDNEKLRFFIEVKNCAECPFVKWENLYNVCNGTSVRVYISDSQHFLERRKIFLENKTELTKSCPRIKKQFEG